MEWLMDNLWKAAGQFRGMSFDPLIIYLEMEWKVTCDRTEPCPDEDRVCSMGTAGGDAHGKVIVPVPLTNTVLGFPIDIFSEKCMDAMEECDNWTAIGQALCLRDVFTDGACKDELTLLQGGQVLYSIQQSIKKALASVDHGFECKCLRRSSNSSYYSTMEHLDRSTRSFNNKLKDHFEDLVKRAMRS